MSPSLAGLGSLPTALSLGALASEAQAVHHWRHTMRRQAHQHMVAMRRLTLLFALRIPCMRGMELDTTASSIRHCVCRWQSRASTVHGLSVHPGLLGVLPGHVRRLNSAAHMFGLIRAWSTMALLRCVRRWNECMVFSQDALERAQYHQLHKEHEGARKEHELTRARYQALEREHEHTKAVAESIGPLTNNIGVAMKQKLQQSEAQWAAMLEAERALLVAEGATRLAAEEESGRN